MTSKNIFILQIFITFFLISLLKITLNLDEKIDEISDSVNFNEKKLKEKINDLSIIIFDAEKELSCCKSSLISEVCKAEMTECYD